MDNTLTVPEQPAQIDPNPKLPTEDGLLLSLRCPKHGDITTSTLTFTFRPSDNAGKPLQFLYCMHCINELLLGLQAENKLPKVEMVKQMPAPAPGTAPGTAPEIVPVPEESLKV
jgi:hypothetical protein